MGLATIDPHSQKEQASFDWDTAIEKRKKIYKEMYGKADKSKESAFVRISIRFFVNYFVSFPQKRNGIVFSSGVNYLHSD